MGFKTHRKTVADDGYAYLCAVCGDFGELLCCEQCGQGFHLHCLNFDSLPEEDYWLCKDCTNNKIRCFECNKYGAFKEDVMKCTLDTCKKFYHKECTGSWGKDHPSRVGLICPQHHCNACGLTRSNGGQWKLLRCLDCPNAYHENCCPDGSRLLDDIPGYLICWRHFGDWKTQFQDAEKIQNPAQVFETLPVPHHCEFEVPRSMLDFVKKQKQRPQPYVNIRRNIYLVKKPKRRLEDEFMHCSCARVGGIRASCGKDCICGMLQYSCSSSCGCGDECANLPFQKRNGRKLLLVKTEKCGWGLIAGEDIKAGDFLIEYVGEVIDDKTCEERLWGMKESGETNFYMCEISREMVIDASFKGNISRFINHSCCPNTQLQKWQIDEEIRIGVFAIADIRLGEPISYDYQFIPFGTDQECLCGAKSCRGMLGAKLSKQKISSSVALQIVTREVMTQSVKKPKLCGLNGFGQIDHFFRQQKPKLHPIADSQAFLPCVKEKAKTTCVGLRVKVWWPLDKKFYSGKIIAFDSRDGTHKIEYDDGELETLSMDKEKWELETSMPLGL